MANTYKNVVITPNIGSNTDDPKVVFSGGNTSANTDITLRVYPLSNGTLSFEGSAGQLFSITNDLANNLFSVSDVSGIPSLEVYANGLVSIAQFSGNVGIGNTTPNAKLTVQANTGTIATFANATVTIATVNATGAYINGTINSTSYTVGTTFTANATLVNAAAINVTGQTNTATLFVTTSANVGANVQTNTSTIFVGNSSVNTSIVAGTVSVNGLALVTNSFVTTNYVNTTQLSGNLSNYAALAGATFSGDVTINANLVVTGTTVSLNVATLNVKDKNITVANGSTAAASDGAGITVDGSNIGWYYTLASNTWTSNVGITPSVNNFTLGSATALWNFTGNAVSAVTVSSSGLANLSSLNVVNQTNTATLFVTTSANVGTAVVANSVGVTTTGFVNAATVVNSASYTIGTTLIANTLGVYHTGTVNASVLSTGTTFVANATQVTIGAIPVSANGSVGTQGFVLTSNGSTGSPYWAAASAGVNTAAQYTWSNTQTFQNTITFSSLANVSSLNVVNQTNTGTLFVTTSANVGTAVIANSVGLTTTGFVNAATVVNSAAHTIGTTLVANTLGVYHTGTVNSAVLSTGTTFVANATQVTIGGIPVSANGNVGTQGFALFSNGATGSPYWAAVVANVNTAAQYTWSNTQTFQNTITFSSQISVGSNVVIGNTTARGSLDVYSLLGQGAIVFGTGTASYTTTALSGIVSKGPTSDGRLMVQDGNGRLNDYWNAYTDAGGYKYIVSGEPAVRHLRSIDATTNGAVIAWYSAPSGTAGGSLSWVQIAQMYANANIWFSPRGTSADFYIDVGGNTGIGTTTPNAKLAVTGTANVSGNIFVGGQINVGNSTVNSYVNSVAVGSMVGFQNPNTLNFDYTTPANYNTVIAGPYTVNPGFTLTITPGTRVAIV